MPLYEYVCDKCENEFELLVRGSEEPACPSCGGKRLSKLLSVIAAPSGATRKTEACDFPASGPCGMGSCGLPECGG